MSRWKREIDAECVRIAYSHLRSAAAGGMVSSLIVGLVIRDRALIPWVSAVWLHAIGRVVVQRQFEKRPRGAHELRGWWWGMMAVMGSAGALYGTAVLLTPTTALSVAVLALAIGGSIAGGAQSIVATPQVLVVASTAAVVPLLVVLVVSGGEFRLIAISALGYLLTVFVMARQNYRNLRASIAMRYENLDLVEQLAERNREKTRFLGAASHDLRQPIHAIALFTSALAAEAGTDRAKHLVGRIGTSVEALEQLLDGLLDISRLDAGVIAPAPRPFAVAALADQLRAVFGETARERGLALRVYDSDLWIAADPDMTAQLVRNLVANAIRYTPAGRVVVGFRRRGERVRIEVWDTGVGIPADQHVAIFREFHQLGNPERDRMKGIGLGLAIVERIAKLLQTEVTLRSTVGKGSVFAIELPIAAAGTTTAAAPVAVAIAANRCVLVVDDDPLAREGLVAILETWGYRVIATSDLDAAARAAERDPSIALVISDFRLRDNTTAVDTLAAIAAKLGRTPPAIILTGETDPARIRVAHDTGHAVLFKPAAPAELRATISRSIG